MKLVRENLILEGMAEREPALISKYEDIIEEYPEESEIIFGLGYDHSELVPYID
jgi:hypothetical protein